MVTSKQCGTNGPAVFGAFNDMDRLFGHLRANAVANPASPVAIWEDAEGSTYLELELPGVANDGLEITVEQGRLTIAAERKAPEGERRYLRNERGSGRFERSFQLPDTVDAESIKATLAQGVLTLQWSKKAEAQPRKITVQVN